MKPAEDPQAEAPYIVGEGEWKSMSALSDMWQVAHQCRDAGLDSETQVTVMWHIFLKQHRVATLEEFLQKFAEGTRKRDYYEFSKYCLALYRKVHEAQLASGLNAVERNLIETFTREAEEMDQLGDEYHADLKDDYWQMHASIACPDFRELPRAYEKLIGGYDSFEDFLEAHKKFDQVNEKPEAGIAIRRKRTAHAVHSALEK